jgi:hypothetical protein
MLVAAMVYLIHPIRKLITSRGVLMWALSLGDLHLAFGVTA